MEFGENPFGPEALQNFWVGVTKLARFSLPQVYCQLDY